MALPYLSIVIPAYNEAERLPETLIDIDKRLSRVDYSYEILVVNDGSKDNTAEVVRNMTRFIRNLKLIDNSENKGKGGVVRQGMLLAKGKIRLFTDADNSTTIDQFDGMMPHFREGVEVVIGSRAVKGSKLDPPQPLFRRLAGKGLNLIAQVILLPGIWDTQCGFKAFTDAATEKVFGLSNMSGWSFDLEVLSLAKTMGFRIKEVPVTWSNKSFSHVPFSAGLQFVADCLKIRWRLWRNKYRISDAESRA